MVETALVTWLHADTRAASNWFAANQGTLSQGSRDTIASAFATFGATMGEIDTSWDWVGQIQDPEIKRRAEGRVWQAEQSQVQREARENPQATVDAIVSGESPHATYWIETAMTEWVARDAAGAQEWYDENRRSLTPEQNEPVALAYARRAIAEADLNAATQWAQHVISERHRAQIEAELAAAAAAASPQ
jgi:hypothetical protein